MFSLPIENTVKSFMSSVDCGQPGKSGVTMYSLSVRQMIESMAGFRMNTEIQLNRKASEPPNASKMYEYSAPDLLISVPSSA